jgi:rfaE bifunctional protein kinase chain/domain
MISLDRLEQLLAGFTGLKIGLLGDLFLDRYLDIDPALQEFSVETGLEAYQVTRIRNSPGALGTVMNNLTALGVGRLVPVTVLGDDGQAYDLLKALRSLPVEPDHILQDAERKTPTYTKPMKCDAAGVWHELNRLDLRNRTVLSAATETRLLEHLSQVFDQTDGLIVVDQVNEEGWGVVTPRVREYLAELSTRNPAKLIFIDSRAFVEHFRCGLLKPNVAECLAALGRPASDKDLPGGATIAACDLSARTGRPLMCTLGERGLLVVDPVSDPVEVPAYKVEGPVDTVGAGDSATAGMVAALLSGATRVEAAVIGNLVASITVQQLGTTGTASPQQVIARWHEAHHRTASA